MPYNVGELIGRLSILGATTATRQLQEVQAGFARAGEAAGAAGVKIDTLEGSLAGAGRTAAVASSGTAKFKIAQLQATAATERFNQLLAQEDVSLGRLASAEAAAIRANERLRASQVAAAESTATMRTEAAAVPGVMTKTASGFAQAGKAALGLGAAFGAFELARKAIDIGKQAADYQKSMTMIQTQAGASAKEVKAFSGELLQMSGKVATAPNDLSLSLYHVYSALKKVGATAPQMLNTVRIAAEGAKVGNTDLEDTTNSLTATLASGIVKFNEAGKAMGMLNAIVGAGDMKFSDLNQALGTGLLVTMKTFGVSMRDTGAALAVFGDNNIRGADAATKLRMAVQDISKAAKNADEVLGKVGLSTEKLRATLEAHGLNGALHLLKDRLDAAGITGKKVGGFLEDAFTKRAGAGLAILITRLHQFDEAAGTIGKAANNFGAAWHHTTQTLSFAFSRIGHEIESGLISVMEKATPALATAGRWLGTTLPHAVSILWAALKPLAEEVGHVLVDAWHGLTAVLKVVGSALSGLGHWMADNSGLVKGFGTAVLAMWGAFKGYTIVKTATLAVRAAFVTMAASARGALTTLSATNEAIWGLFTGTGSKSHLTALMMQRDGLEIGAAAEAEAAKVARAKAQEAEDFAMMVRESDDATAHMISDAENRALALQAEADEAEASAARVAAAARTAAADVETAGSVAEVGWAQILGPLALIGVGIAAFTAAFHHNSDAAAQNAQRQQEAKQQIEGLTQAIEEDNGVLGKNTELYVANALQKSGAATAAQQVGVSLRDLQRAAMGSAPAQQRINAALAEWAKTASRGVVTTGTLNGHLSEQDKRNQALAQAWQKVKNAIGGTNKSVEAALQGSRQMNGLLGTGTSKTNQQKTAQQQLNQATQQWRQSLVQANSALMTLIQTELSQQQNQDAFKEGLLNMHAALKQNGHSLSDNTLKGLANRDMLISLLQSAQSVAQGMKNPSAAMRRMTGDVLDFAKKNHLAMGTVRDLLDQMHLLPKDIPLHADPSPAEQDIKKLQGEIDAIKQGKIPGLTANSHDGERVIATLQGQIDALKQHKAPAVNVNVGTALSNIHSLQDALNALHSKSISVTEYQNIKKGVMLSGSASGGGLPEGVSAVGERGPELAVKSGSSVQILSNSQSKAFLASTGMRAPGFAGGTLPGGITTSGKGSNQEWTYGGIKYSSLSAAENARTRDQQQSAKDLKTAVHALVGGLRSFLRSLGSVSSERSSFRSLLGEVRKAGGSSDLISGLKSDNTALDEAIRLRIKDAAALAAATKKLHDDRQKMNQEIRSVSQAGISGFDVTQAGAGANGNVSAGALRAQQMQYLTRLRKWGADLKKINKIFGKSPAGKAMVLSLAQAGPDGSWGQVEALAHAGPQLLREIAGTEQQISSVSRSIGGFIGTSQMGQRVAIDRRQVEAGRRLLQRADHRVEHDAAVLERAVLNAFSQLNLKVDFDPRGVARLVAVGDHKRKPAHPRSQVKAGRS